jgi:hypothetical protein
MGLLASRDRLGRRRLRKRAPASLTAGHGLFFDGHRALHDCEAALDVLSRPLSHNRARYRVSGAEFDRAVSPPRLRSRSHEEENHAPDSPRDDRALAAGNSPRVAHLPECRWHAAISQFRLVRKGGGRNLRRFLHVRLTRRNEFEISMQTSRGGAENSRGRERSRSRGDIARSVPGSGKGDGRA